MTNSKPLSRQRWCSARLVLGYSRGALTVPWLFVVKKLRVSVVFGVVVLVTTMKTCVPFFSILALFFMAPLSHAGVDRSDVNTEIGYAEVVQAGDYLYFSGNVGAGEMPDAVRAAYNSLGSLLAERGLSFKDVVKETVYTTNLDAFKENRSVRKVYYDGVYPASTWVQVARLYEPEFVVEVELIVYSPRYSLQEVVPH